MRRSRLTSDLGQVVIDTMVGMDKDSSSDSRYLQHARSPPLKMRKDAKIHQPFRNHFELQTVFTTARKYLTDRKEKQLIRMYQSQPNKSYDILRGRPSADPLYWIWRRK